jgi:formylglycine-generating enzyme
MKRFALIYAVALLLSCSPNYQSGSTECSDTGACPSGFVCGGTSTTSAPDVCYSQTEAQCSASDVYYCPTPSSCWPAKVACSTIVLCPNGKASACRTEGYIANCSGTGQCTNPSSGAGGSGGSGGSGGMGGVCNPSSTDTPCDTCMEQSCCSQLDVCAGQTICVDLLNCIAACASTDTTCIGNCESSYSAGIASLTNLVTCVDNYCNATCGTGGTGGSTWGGTAPSCSGLTATCGPLNESCCTSLLVPGGTFDRSYDGVAPYADTSYPATLADFYLDKYEITVGRFRQFVNAGMGTRANPPASGAGAHLGLTGSGWDSTWNTSLPANTAALEAAIECDLTYQTWTHTAGSNESMPVNCLDWYTAFAFCAWDGGRLATEAEWNYAASGGSDQRYYPWSIPATSTTIDDSHAVYCGGLCSTRSVGSKSPKGDGKWGQSDLAGNVWEWTLDRYESPYPMPCDNCADLSTVSGRVLRGGAFANSASALRSAYRSYDYAPKNTNSSYVGSRCARTSL